MKTTIAILDKKGENAIPRLVAALEESTAQREACFELATTDEVTRETSINTLKANKATSAIAVGHASSKPPQNVETFMAKLDNATLTFEGRIYSPAKLVSKAAIDGKIRVNYRRAVASLLKRAQGDFAVLIIQSDEILAARDPVGVQPLYYGQNESIAALATNRTALWKLGIADPKSFLPGHVATVTREGFQFEPVKALEFAKPKPLSMEEAAHTLRKLLESSVRVRVAGHKKVAVAFSGGLDSSVVACLAKRCGVEVHLIHVSLEGQPETEEAYKASEALELPMQVHLYKQADVEEVISKVVQLIEEPDPVKASVGVPFFWNAQRAAELELNVMLAGQGADELFGGYQRYVMEYISKGDEAVRKTMFHDVTVIHESNIERDEKICNYHDIELRLPFASFAVAEFAMNLSTELKFEPKAESLRKLVLRKAAENMGLPKSIVEKPKKAVQYSTGINNALRKIAKRKNMTLAEYVNNLFLQTRNRT